MIKERKKERKKENNIIWKEGERGGKRERPRKERKITGEMNEEREIFGTNATRKDRRNKVKYKTKKKKWKKKERNKEAKKQTNVNE